LGSETRQKDPKLVSRKKWNTLNNRKTNMNPLELFADWYEKELGKSTVRIPSACCFSTIGLDGFPNSRFVSLKEVKDNTFIVTGPLNSRKGLEVERSEKVSLTFWWTATEKQVRVQGNAKRMAVEDSEKYFSEREREAQIVSHASEQGKPIENREILDQRYKSVENTFRGKQVSRPENWGGFFIEPLRIEFMEFKPSRFHERTVYLRGTNTWEKQLLQP
jgi:pyridoxamine 5'-phosphate oxidase